MSTRVLRVCVLMALTAVMLTLAAAPVLASNGSVAPKVRLGAFLAGDRSLSDPDGQACADCHFPRAGYADPDQGLPVSQGVLPGLFGGRNAPTWAYTAWSPALRYDETDEAWIGGMFWDGRASGWELSPLAEQAKGPFLNQVEMRNASAADVIAEVRTAPYAALFRHVFGRTSLQDVDEAYDDVARAIAAYESSRWVNTFTSRFDAYMAGKRNALSEQETRGLELFNGKGMCSQCHPSAPGPYSTGRAEGKALFTDYTYDNLGIPKNPAFALPAFGLDPNAVDLGLGGFLRGTEDPELVAYADAADGAFKVSTLRNIARTAPYGHNGYFATLEEIVHFYNTRDVAEAAWPAPEVPVNVNTDELGNLGLTDGEEADLVAFLRALNDQVVVPIAVH